MKAGEEVEIMKRMRTEKGRRLKTFGLALMFVVLLFVQVKNAKAAEIQSGTCGKNGDNLVWTFDSDEILTISGTGEMAGFPKYDRYNSKLIILGEGNAPWKSAAARKLVIMPGVTSIGYSAFTDNEELEEISLPNGLLTIENGAFATLTNLKSVRLPESVTELGEYVFGYSTGISELYLPSGLKKAGRSCFAGCKGLTKITLPQSLESLGDSAFSDCSGIREVTIPEKITVIPPMSFEDCTALEKVVVSGNVTQIGYNAFSGCTALQNIALPGVKTIGSSAFSGCTDLTEVQLEKVTFLDTRAFSGTGLRKIILPSTMKTIGNGCFEKCAGLTEVILPESLNYIRPNAFNQCSSLKSITVPGGVKTLEGAVFSGCTGLTEAVLSEGVREIGFIDFYNCSSLKSICIPASCTKIGERAFDGCVQLKDIYYGGSESEWKAISVNEEGNDALKKAVVHFNWKQKQTDNRENYIGKSQIGFHYSASNDERRTWQFLYSDYMFYVNDNTVHFNVDLAKASLSAVLSAYSDVRVLKSQDDWTAKLPETDTRRAANILELYKNLKFSDPVCYHYDIPLTDASDKVAFSVAHKYINAAESSDDYTQGEDTVVAVIIRGGRYGAEWASNFNVVNGTNYNTDHYGFSTAAKDVEEKVTAYVNGLKKKQGGIRGDLKIWISGYSRGSAVANKVAHDFNSSGVAGITIKPGDMYAYTFATPNVANTYGTGDVSSRKYSKDADIFNIVSPLDPVPRVPLESWGYGRYGQTLYLPTNMYPALWDRYTALSGKSLKVGEEISSWQNVVVIVLQSLLKALVPERSDYRSIVQDILWKAFYDNNQQLKHKENIVVLLTEVLELYDSGQIDLPGIQNEIYLIRQLINDGKNLGRAHEPEYYYARLEKDNFAALDSFTEQKPGKMVLIQGKTKNLSVQVMKSGAVVGGFSGGTFTPADGGNAGSAEISAVGDMVVIYMDPDCEVSLSSDTNMTVSYETISVDGNYEPQNTRRIEEVQLSAGKARVFSAEGKEIIPAAEQTAGQAEKKDADSVLNVEKKLLAQNNDNDPKKSTFAPLKAKASVAKTSVTLSWSKVKGAKGYVIYGNACGKKNHLVKLTTTKKTKVKIQKIGKTKLKKGTYYKFVVVAYKKAGGYDQSLAVSKMIHAATSGGKVTNAKSIKLTNVKKNTISLKKGKSFAIKTKVVSADPKLKMKNHRKLSYESSSKSIATVSAKGKITAKKKGTCTIYIYTQNGVCAKLKVKVS